MPDNVIFEGVYTALVTPFSLDGQVDYDRLRNLIHLQAEAGVTDIAEMTNIGKELRAEMADAFVIERPEITTSQISEDGTRKWLLRQERRRDANPGEFQTLDLVVCDPPVFASAKDGGKFSIEAEWPGLAAATSGLMSPEGIAVFANNHRSGNHAFYRRALEDHFREVTDLRPPLDFPVLPGRPHHVRTFWCVK